MKLCSPLSLLYLLVSSLVNLALLLHTLRQLFEILLNMEIDHFAARVFHHRPINSVKLFLFENYSES